MTIWLSRQPRCCRRSCIAYCSRWLSRLDRPRRRPRSSLVRTCASPKCHPKKIPGRFVDAKPWRLALSGRALGSGPRNRVHRTSSRTFKTSGSSEAWYRARFGTERSRVRIPPSRRLICTQCEQRRRFAKAAGSHRTGLKSSIRPDFYWDLGWRWLLIDDHRTAFGHTGGHTGADANVCLSGTRCATLFAVKLRCLGRREEREAQGGPRHRVRGRRLPHRAWRPARHPGTPESLPFREFQSSRSHNRSRSQPISRREIWPICPTGISAGEPMARHPRPC
jgi:hypothetical protein